LKLRPFSKFDVVQRRFCEAGFVSSFDLDELDANEAAKPLGFTPGDPPIVFFDIERFPNRRTREPVLRDVAKVRARDLFQIRELSVSDLELWSVARSSRADENFRRRGFVSTFECRGLGKGDNNPEPTHLARNRAAACLQLTTVAGAFPTYNASERRFTTPARRRPQPERQAFRKMANFLGAHAGDTKTTALICRKGIFLPKALRAPGIDVTADPIFMAFSSKLAPAMELGHADPFRILAALPQEKAVQAQFEYDHSDLLFKASRPALLLWQTQVLAYLRVASWMIAFHGSKTYQDAISDAKAHVSQRRYVATWRALVRGEGRVDGLNNLKDPMERAFETEEDRTLEELADEGVNVLGASCAYGLSTAQTFIAALHGGTYGPLTAARSPTDEEVKWALREDPMRILTPIGAWLGALKRGRYANLDCDTAERFTQLESDDEEQGMRLFLPIVKDRLGGEVWDILMQACKELVSGRIAGSIEVAYEWTRDLQQPWSAERVDDHGIRIKGTLLDFPLRNAVEWTRQADTLWRPEEENFQFPGVTPPLR
jgi:hypothetical protein